MWMKKGKSEHKRKEIKMWSRYENMMNILWRYEQDMMKIGRYEDMKMWFENVIMWKYAYIIVVTKLNFFLV